MAKDKSGGSSRGRSAALAKAKQKLKDTRKSARARMEKMRMRELVGGGIERTATLTTAYGAGRYGDLVSRASIGPMPGEGTVAILAFAAAAAIGPGYAGKALAGVGDGAASAGLFRMGERHALNAGAPAAAGAAGEDELPALERRLRELEATTPTAGGVDDELEWAEAAQAAGWAPPGEAAGADDDDDDAWAEAAQAAGWAPPGESAGADDDDAWAEAAMAAGWAPPNSAGGVQDADYEEILE